MAYLVQSNPQIVNDITNRKEFYQTKKYDRQPTILRNIIPEFILEDYREHGLNLQLKSYQMFVKNFLNPNTPYRRLLIKHTTGTGKSIGGLSIAMNFIDVYRKENDAGVNEIGSVFIIGFSERVFKNELLRFPEFGFINRSEKKKLLKLRAAKARGNHVDAAAYTELVTKIKKRLSNRKGNGFFKFYGYKAFVNRIFKSNENITDMSEQAILNALKSGKIQLDEDLLKQFRNSIIICDEIHNVYNSNNKNNWGIALQVVLDRSPTTRAVFMSATPLNNNPMEVVDLANLLLPVNSRIEREQFFQQNGQPLPGSIEKLKKLMTGRVSFLRDSNPEHYPKLHMIGEKLKAIPSLKFVRCPMSDFHYNTYKEVYTGALSQDSQYLVDFALPNPNPNSAIGLYQTGQIKRLLALAPVAWKQKHGIDFVNGEIVGDFMLEKNIGKYSSKYLTLLKTLKHALKNKYGKILIYHNIVHMSGVLFIKQLLLANGYLDEFSSSAPNTLCAICGSPKNIHKPNQIIGGFANKKDSEKLLTETLRAITDGNITRVFVAKSEIPIISYIEDSKFYYVPAASTNWIIFNKPEYKYLLNDLLIYFRSVRKKPIIIETLQSSEVIHKWISSAGTILYETRNYKYFIINYSKFGGCETMARGYITGAHERKNKISRKVAQSVVKSQLDNKHTFVPVRFILAHSDIDKSHMDHSIEKYNNPENVLGNIAMILIGSKIIRESYNFKAVQNSILVARPDNISTLIQIRGRSVRKGSHNGLPPEMRNVRMTIITSCLPIKQKIGPDKGKYIMSYEEQKYMEKMKSYQIIQKIEREVMHKNAIDAVMNRNIIWSKSDVKAHKQNKLDDNLTDLWFDPVLPKAKTELSLKQLNTHTFDVYYAQQEIDNIVVIIKKLFLQISPAWKYNELWEAVRNPTLNHPSEKNINYSLESEINTELFTKENFINALNQLVWSSKSKYTEPFLEKNHSSAYTFIDRLLDPNDRIIVMPNGSENIIVQLGELYVRLPINVETKEPIYDVELPYRNILASKDHIIDVNSFLSNRNMEFDYSDKKELFKRKWENRSIENMQETICEYGSFFHIKFLEECIVYIFNVWTKPNQKKSKWHEFYFKMLYYYDLMGLVLWASTAKNYVAKRYSKYIYTPKQIEPLPTNDKSQKESGLINLLKSSINKSSNIWANHNLRNEFQKQLDQSLNIFKTNKKNLKKVSSNLLPIGHTITKIPKTYLNKWQDEPNYTTPADYYIENDLIIGYDERSDTGVLIRFKIRNPIQSIKQFQDSRMIERGSVCKSKSKKYLKDIAAKLNIKIPTKINVDQLCKEIKSNLMRKELMERTKGTKKKWFYFHYESRPGQ